MSPPAPPPLPPPLPPTSGPASPPPPAVSGSKSPALLVVGIAVGVGLLVLLCLGVILAGISLPALAKAKSRATQVRCINNLKMLGLAARIYSVDHAGKFPARWEDARAEIGRPDSLVCPALKSPPEALASFEAARAASNYVYEGAGATEEDEPRRILSVCPIHQVVVLADGTVEHLPPAGSGRLVTRNGVRYLEPAGK